MLSKHFASAITGGSRRHRPRSGLAGRTALATLACTLAITGTAGLAGAAVRPAKASTSSNPYAKVEKQLSSLEHPPSGVSLLETGSTLLYPVISEWASQYPATKVTTAGTGSGAGISDATNGTVQIGASDAYLSPGAPANLLDIPVDVSAQQIDYNLPGLGGRKHLRLDATVINNIFDGSITNWDNSAITKLNPGVKLPNMTIVPLHRSDGSGDTFMFSSYLAYQDPSSWVPSHGGPNTAITWPSNPNQLAENGNGGMLAGCEKTPGCIAYIGISWLRSALAAGIGVAQLLNGSHNYVLPTPANIASEVASYKKVPATGAISLINSKSVKFGYPIVNFEYAIVNENQSSGTVAGAIKAFLAWGMDPRHGSSTHDLTDFYFHPLAPSAMQIAVNLLKKIR